jgi:hypothetical protein
MADRAVLRNGPRLPIAFISGIIQEGLMLLRNIGWQVFCDRTGIRSRSYKQLSGAREDERVKIKTFVRRQGERQACASCLEISRASSNIHVSPTLGHERHLLHRRPSLNCSRLLQNTTSPPLHCLIGLFVLYPTLDLGLEDQESKHYCRIALFGSDSYQTGTSPGSWDKLITKTVHIPKFLFRPAFC